MSNYQLTSSRKQADNSHVSKYSSRRVLQKSILVWLDQQSQHDLRSFQDIITTIYTFSDVDECIYFIITLEDKKVCLILSNVCSDKLVPLIDDIPQIDSIYLFSATTLDYDLPKNKSSKVKGTFSQIESVRTELKKDVNQQAAELIPISIVPLGDYLKQDSKELPATFMYTQILKEILFEIKYKDDAKEDLVHFWYEQYHDNEAQLQTIDEFDRDYVPDSAIRWYTRENFTYSMLNRVLRTLDIEVIIKMGFFLRDLHRQIEQLHGQQSNMQVPLIVYRGQGVSKDDFIQMRKAPGGLLSFNNFLSTSTNEQVSRIFCPNGGHDPDVIAVLFKIHIDPTLTRIPFAWLNGISQHDDEEEILFSMHAIFRIGEIIEIEKDLWRIELKSTSDDDEELKEITKYIREELLGQTGWHRLSNLLFKMGEYEKAEEIYRMLLKQTHENDLVERYFLYSELGMIKHHKGDFVAANEFYRKVFEIQQIPIFSHHLNTAAIYNNIASVHVNKAEYSQALIIYQKARQIEEELLPPNHLDLAITYNNIAFVYKKEAKYTEALNFYEKARLIYQTSLPSNHPDLVLIHNNIALTYLELGNYDKALELQREVIKIMQKSLPSDHPHLANTYCAIGLIQKKRGEYSKASILYEKAIEIYKKKLLEDHPSFAIIYSNLASLSQSQGQPHKALEFYQKALNIEQKRLHQDHPDIAISYSNIATIYNELGDYSKSLELSYKALEIWKKLNTLSHPSLGTIYQNIAAAHYQMGQYSQALNHFQHALTILRRTLPAEHPSIQECQTNIYRTLEHM
ncbi:unnamed protein product [Adineta steineri]|uniref:Tetratricopeptide repeat protein n=1 Tax=Adineta steineri TaxID=433720 RepID=A0A814TI72_9BILA|nr:unnamed protein product [Adineta steineri]CAF1158523.1 unnamed protein product [Adineta steineri]CAF3663316.1 unnamed protein product [Adineta steineri]CAF3726203.1 unnamed protein product [Adineta steineri]